MHSARSRSTYLRVFKFLKIKEGHLISGGNHFCRKWIICPPPRPQPPLLYFNFKIFKDPNSLLFIRFLGVLYDSEELLSDFWNFCKLKMGDLISGGEPILQIVWINWSPLLYLNFKSFMDPNSSPCIRFQCIQDDSGVLFSESWNVYKLKRGNLVSGWKQFCRKSELFGPPFCISVLKVLWTQILYHALDFNAFCIIQEHYSQTFKVFTN